MRRLLVSSIAAITLLTGFVLVLGPDRLASQLAGADPMLFALGLLAVVLALACWSEASRRLFVSTNVSISPSRSFLAYGAGAFGKQVLPMGNAGGPAVMAYAFDRELEQEYSRTLGVIVVAEFLSLVASLVLAIVGIAVLLSLGSLTQEVQWLGVAVLTVAAIVASLAVVVWYRRSAVQHVLTGVARTVEPIVGRFSSGLAARLTPDRIAGALARYYETIDAVVADRRALASAFLLTQLGWVLFAVPLYTSALALGIDLPVALVLFVVPAAGLATVVPLPGGLGGIELALVGLLTAFTTIELTAAGATVVLYRLCAFWFFVVVCGLCVSVGSMRASTLTSSIDSRSDASAEPVGDE